ncbi:biorientation of chromosomes in cell division protein 1-like 1 [Ostrinia furnacalis]|uniref:biorientation of chromosomes in cell division protein 1-like 1 n=1 Tax=Ostrinia furnacalis TaxID=93504 RepID=UPI00103EF00B|nr:biorientation of chromosomes in cell division protein 1-like 1 [Ostrinia furnacalis]
MAHLQYIPGDPRLVDQLVYELKSKGIFDQFRKDCIADVDTRPAYQNLRQRVENSVSTFLARQCWKPDLNKNQLREKLRKHILDGNYLEQGVERIVDQVVNPKVATVFIPQVEDLVYNYLGITRKKTTPVAETSNGKVTDNDLLPTDLEAVSPASVKSNDDKTEAMETSHADQDNKMDVDFDKLKDEKDHSNDVDVGKTDDTRLSGISELTSNDSMASMDKSSIPLPSEEIKLENIPAPDNSPPKITKIEVELEKIELPEEPDLSRDIPLPNETPKSEKEVYFKPVNTDDDDSSSDSSLRRNMSPLTPIRNFNNENSCDAQQAFENEDSKDDKKDALEPSTFRFTIEKTENSSDAVKMEKNETEQANLSYQFTNQMNINTFNTPMYDDSSNSTHLQIDYESDANSKTNVENKVPEPDHNSGDSRKDKKTEERKSSHKSSHRDSHRHSSSKDRRSDSKQSSSKDSRSDRKSSKDDRRSSSKSNTKEKSSERDKKDEKKDRDSSKHRSSHKSSSSNSHKDSKSHRSSSSSQRHSSSSKHDEKRSSSSSHRDKSDRSSDKYSKDKSSKESRSSSNSTRDKDRKSGSSSKSKSEDKDRQKKDKKDADDHYSASGRGNHTRRSTDRDSNDGSSSSKGSHHPTGSKSTENKKETKSSTSKSDNTSTSGESTSPSDKDSVTDKSKNESKGKNKNAPQVKPIVRIENHLETPISSPPRLPFVPDVTLKKPKFAANMQEARKLMKMRKFLDDEQKRMNQEAALLLEFQANVRPSLSQVYSSIPGPELEFACVTSNQREMIISDSQIHSETANSNIVESSESRSDTISDILTAAEQVENIEVSNVEDQVNSENAPAETESIVVEGEIDDEANQNADTATVQIENIIETDINACEMEVDVSIDDNKIEIIDNESTKSEIRESESNHTNKVELEIDSGGDDIEAQLQSLMPDDDVGPEYLTVTIIAEELSETEETNAEPVTPKINLKPEPEEKICPDEPEFKYFAEHEKYNSELERDTFSKFLKTFIEKSSTDKIHVINCEGYVENILKEVSQNFGQFEIVNYHKNGHLKLNTAKNIVRNVNVSSEITLPIDKVGRKNISPMFSPVKSECSFELSSDYDAKLEEMVSKTSRKEIMEIILGNVIDDPASDSSLELPTIDYCMDSNIESDTENTMKRKFCEVESSVNNNRQVLTPNKIRKLSGSDQISSTTEESEETSNNNVSNTMRSKYLGRAKRVGLPRPRRSNLPNSPSSDKSVENYEQNTATPNGRVKPRKVQRYDTSDLYKPKLHYLSRRNNIS